MKELHEKNKAALDMKQKQIDDCEAEINRIKRMMQQQDRDIQFLQSQHDSDVAKIKDMDEEMELKSGENNRMRKRLAEMDMAL
jgi:septal ring factor EnvC (AmiA/AmiB activator)